jgi:hypothetical protein
MLAELDRGSYARGGNIGYQSAAISSHKAANPAFRCA